MAVDFLSTLNEERQEQQQNSTFDGRTEDFSRDENQLNPKHPFGVKKTPKLRR